MPANRCAYATRVLPDDRPYRDSSNLRSLKVKALRGPPYRGSRRRRRSPPARATRRRVPGRQDAALGAPIRLAPRSLSRRAMSEPGLRRAISCRGEIKDAWLVNGQPALRKERSSRVREPATLQSSGKETLPAHDQVFWKLMFPTGPLLQSYFVSPGCQTSAAAQGDAPTGLHDCTSGRAARGLMSVVYNARPDACRQCHRRRHHRRRVIFVPATVVVLFLLAFSLSLRSRLWL